MNNNNNNFTLQKLIQINNSLDNINTFNYMNPNYNSNIKYIYNKQNNSEVKIKKNNYSQTDSPLNELIAINKGIDSIYDNMKLMKSSNKINSKVLYQISRSSQTF